MSSFFVFNRGRWSSPVTRTLSHQYKESAPEQFCQSQGIQKGSNKDAGAERQLPKEGERKRESDPRAGVILVETSWVVVAAVAVSVQCCPGWRRLSGPVAGGDSQSRNDEPDQENAGHPEEHLGHYLVLSVFLAAHGWGRAAISKVERGRKQAKRKGTDPKRHVEASVSKAKGREGPRMTFGFRSLSRWPRGQFFPGVLLGAAPAVQGDHFVPADARLAHGAHLAVGPRLQPLVQAGPAKQVSTQADHSVLGRVEADVALKAAILLSSSRAAAFVIVR